jgi:hypothetical protein
MAVLLGSCGPIYNTVKDYHLPTGNPSTSTCSNMCLHNRSICKTRCERTKHDCSVLEERKANNEYNDYLRRSCREVRSTQYHSHKKHRKTHHRTTQSSVSCDSSKTLKDFRNSWRCDNHNNACKNDCESVYDSCFVGCGGRIEERQVCVFNCNSVN